MPAHQIIIIMKYKILSIIAAICFFPAGALVFITSFAMIHMAMNGHDIPPDFIGWWLLGMGICWGLFRLIAHAAKMERKGAMSKHRLRAL